MVATDRASASAAHWSPQQYDDLFQAPDGGDQRLALVAGQVAGQGEAAPPDPPDSGGPKNLAGFLIARHVAPDWELENIVVSPAARRMGIAKCLVDALLSAAR